MTTVLLIIHLFVTLWPRDDDGIGPIVDCRGTCCRVAGTEILLPTGSAACGPDSTLAYDDLIAAPPPVDGFGFADASAPAHPPRPAPWSRR